MNTTTHIIEIVITVVSTIGIVQLLEYIRDRKSNKIKGIEQSKQEVENTKQEQIDTISSQYDLLIKVMNMIGELTNSVSTKDNTIHQKLEELDNKITNIELYLNGEFKNWKKNKR